MPVNGRNWGDGGLRVRHSFLSGQIPSSSYQTIACACGALAPPHHHVAPGGAEAAEGCTSALRLWALRDKDRDCHLLTDVPPAKRSAHVTCSFSLSLWSTQARVVSSWLFLCSQSSCSSVLAFQRKGRWAGPWQGDNSIPVGKLS